MIKDHEDLLLQKHFPLCSYGRKFLERIGEEASIFSIVEPERSNNLWNVLNCSRFYDVLEPIETEVLLRLNSKFSKITKFEKRTLLYYKKIIAIGRNIACSSE